MLSASVVAVLVTGPEAPLVLLAVVAAAEAIPQNTSRSLRAHLIPVLLDLVE